jgi:hypothetical protein
LKQCLASEGINSEQYSTALRNMTSTVLLKRGQNGGIASYFPKDTVLQMAAKIKLSQHFFFDLVRELSETLCTTCHEHTMGTS